MKTKEELLIDILELSNCIQPNSPHNNPDDLDELEQLKKELSKYN